MSRLAEVQERNREVARQVKAEAHANPHSPYTGKMIGIANGPVFVVAGDREELALRLSQIEPDPRKTYCLEAGVDSDAVEEIWEMC